MRTPFELLALATLIGCVDVPLAPEAADLADAARVEEGSASAFGILALLNDASTDLDLLDLDVALDKRAASALVWHRNGPDGVLGTADDDAYDSIAEVDDQHYVGASALQKLGDYAAANGWVPQGGDVVGTWDGVAFTFDELGWTLDLANTATDGDLDDAYGLDRRAVDSILDARPIDTMDELAGLYFVGGSALERLKLHATDTYGGGAAEWEDCDVTADCATGLLCLGEYQNPGNGMFCVSEDLAGTFSAAPAAPIPDGDPAGVSSAVEVVGLASVPIDVVVTLDIDHARPQDLRVVLEDCNGQIGVVWDHEANPSNEVVVRAFPSDDMVLGTWTLTVVDDVTGVEGTLASWDLYIVSLWD